MTDAGQKETLTFFPGQRLGDYELIRQVGAGGMGIVFEARHRERNTVVALKTLHKLDPVALWRLKTEFRSVADVLHHNLVLLHELCFTEGIWFFTMEYVAGENLATRLKRATVKPHAPVPSVSMDMDTQTLAASGAQSQPTPVSTEPTLTSELPEAVHSTPVAQEPPPGSVGKWMTPVLESGELRRIFSQLAEGILTLHEMHRLHCDIKPANVMVAEDGRVVLLDFGLVNERSAPRHEALLMGTPSYMAPEQAAGAPATEATDWYALGIMLYEALSGQRPFPLVRSLEEVRSREAAPLPPSPHIPEDLRRLCMALLHRLPAQRPTGRQVLAVLRGEAHPGVPETTPQLRPPVGRLLMGRQQHLSELEAAYRTMQGGRPVTLHVYGRSGMGKTSLVQHFLDGLQRQERVLVLHGRCYERESVPYKGFDSLIDSLTQYLGSLKRHELQALLPEDLSDLVRVFPVLQRVMSPAPRASPEEPRDKQEARRRAFQALKVLLHRLAEHIPLVLHIDDLQWGAPDSFTLLHGLLTPPDAPRLLLLCSLREEGAGASAVLAEHRRLKSLLGESVDIREVEVGPLPPASARELAALLLQRPEEDAQVQAVVRESQGAPFFLEELVRYTLTSLPHPGETATLEKVVLSRVAHLPEETRRLLELVAVAGRNLPQGIAARAADLQGDSHKHWSLLRTQCLVRTHGVRDESPVECYHDRIREPLSNSLSPVTLQECHRRLAESYEAAGTADPEVLAQHLLGAGLRERAGHALTLAGHQAADALAFERAAELYRQALECRPEDTSLLTHRADALVNAGRCAQSAPLYLQAARAEAEDKVFSLHLRSAEQWLVSGHIDEGLAVLRPLLEQVGVVYPATPPEALQHLLETTQQLQTRGIGFQERAEEDCPPELLRRIDVVWAAGKGLGSIDSLRGAYFNLVATRLALECGEPRRICLGLAWTGVLMTSQAAAEPIAWGTELLREAERIARRLESPQLLGYTQVLSGLAVMVQLKMPQALEHFAEGLRLLRQCTGVSWETSQAWSCSSAVMWQHGALRELGEKVMTWWQHSKERGDHYGVVWLQLYASSILLAAGDAVAAGRLVDEVQAMLSTQIFTPQHLLCVIKACDSDLYRGAPEAAWERLEKTWQLAEASHAMAWPVFRIPAVHTRGMSAVALARQRPSQAESLLSSVEVDAASLDQVGQQCMSGAPLVAHYAHGVAALLRAAVAASRGLREPALTELENAIERFDASEVRLLAACARRRKGELLGGDEGQALLDASTAALQAQGIREPTHWMDVHAPGFASLMS